MSGDKFEERGFDEIDRELNAAYNKIKKEEAVKKLEGGVGIPEDVEVRFELVGRERLMYDHLFDVLEQAIYQCTANSDPEKLCSLMEAFDNILALGLAMGWIRDGEEEEDA